MSFCSYHSRYGDWSNKWKKIREWGYHEKVDSDDGKEHYKIVGVKVSTKPIYLTKKDKRHQNVLF